MSTLPAGESRLLIDGKLVPARSGKLYPNTDPATEETIGHVAVPGEIERGQLIEASDVRR